MPIPTLITDLTTTAATNSPAGGESVTTADDYLRAQASFIAQLRDRVQPVALGGTGSVTAPAAADALGAFRRGTIVGTCSQASGIPTGNIIEAGINANGTYTRYADGTQTCTMSFPNLVAVPLNTVVATISKSYPAAFIVVPAVSASAAPVTSNDCYGVVSCNVSLGGVTLLIRNGGSVAQDFQTITAIAIGRWF